MFASLRTKINLIGGVVFAIYLALALFSYVQAAEL